MMLTWECPLGFVFCILGASFISASLGESFLVAWLVDLTFASLGWHCDFICVVGGGGGRYQIALIQRLIVFYELMERRLHRCVTIYE